MCNLAFIAFKVLFIHTIAFFAKSGSITSSLLYILTFLSLCLSISSDAINLQVRVCDLCEILDDTIQDVGTSVKNANCDFSDCLKRNKLNIYSTRLIYFQKNLQSKMRMFIFTWIQTTLQSFLFMLLLQDNLLK